MKRSHLFAYAAFGWCFVFVVPHIYWAAGGTAGWDEPVEGVLAAINYTAIALTIVAAALALALVRPWGARLSRRVLLAAAWTASISLGLRGAVGLIQDVFAALGRSEEVATLLLVFEPLFLIGGIFFGLAAREHGRSTAAAPRNLPQVG